MERQVLGVAYARHHRQEGKAPDRRPSLVTGYEGSVCGQVQVAVSTMRGRDEDRSVRRIRKGSGLLGGRT